MLVKSNTLKDKDKKTDQALGDVAFTLIEWVESQKDIHADNQLAHQELCNKISELVDCIKDYYKEEEKEEEKPVDTSVADAIKNLKFPQQPKIDFEPFNKVATQLEQQNKLIAELASKFQQSERKENHSIEPFMREFMAVISNNSNALSLLKPPTPKDDTMLLSTIKDAIGNNKVKEWEFTVQYNANDSISKITAKPKI